MIDKEMLFYEKFNTIVARTERVNKHRRARGRVNLKISAGIAVVAYISIIAMLIRLNADISFIGLIGILALVVTIYAHHIVNHPDTRYYIGTLKNKDVNTNAFINKLFRASKLNIKFDNQPEMRTAKEHIESLDIFKNHNKPPHYQYFNKISGFVGGKNYNLYNLSIRNRNNKQLKIFNGTLGVIPIDTPEHYYLRVTPRMLLQDYRQQRINYINTETLQIPEDRSDRLLSCDYDIFTNDEIRTERILNRHVTPYFETLYNEGTLNSKNMNDADAVNILHSVTQSLKAHRIEVMIIQNKTLYVLLPFRNMKSNRKYPFDITTNKNIDPELLWSDVQDVIEKTEILNDITNSSGKKIERKKKRSF